MSTTTAHRPARPTPAQRHSNRERAIAVAESAAPVVAGLGAPFLNTSAAFLCGAAYLAAAGINTANYMNALPAHFTTSLPAADVLRAHREPLLVSTITTGIAYGFGALTGEAGMDALMFSIANLPSPAGIVSLAWWAAVGLVPLTLRRVLFPHPARQTTVLQTPAPDQPLTPEAAICALWAEHISGPANSRHRGQELTLRTIGAHRWTGTINAPAGTPANVTSETVSSVYEKPKEWIHVTEGGHAGEQHITVNLIAPPELDATTLEGAWKRYAARTGGLMANTHLKDVTPDPHTGGEVAYVVANDAIDKLPVPDRESLAGALRTNTLLISYEPVGGNPRLGTIRKMRHNPLEEGFAFPGTDALKISEGGYIQIGRHTSGFPARVQFADPTIGARHIFIAGVTGSGKGGTVQLLSLADHVNGHAIIYGDPKGSSNPDVETMACFSGVGEVQVMGSIRVLYGLMRHRIDLTKRLRMKNFQANPEMPWVRFILDEAHVPLTELHETKQEAGVIMEAAAAKARSLGIALEIVNQAVNADKLGGSSPMRMNVIQGGSLIMLRSDSGQQHLVSTGFEGIDPGKIPASWDVKRPLVYDEKAAVKDPKATFGLGYTLGPGGSAEMFRTYMLESAAPYIDPTQIVYPMDWPDWQYRDEIALEPVDIKSAKAITDGDTDRPTQFTGVDLTTKHTKPKTAAEKITELLRNAADPDGEELIYIHREDISRITGVEGPTLNNAFNALVKAGTILRSEDERGEYAFPLPAAD